MPEEFRQIESINQGSRCGGIWLMPPMKCKGTILREKGRTFQRGPPARGDFLALFTGTAARETQLPLAGLRLWHGDFKGRGWNCSGVPLRQIWQPKWDMLIWRNVLCQFLIGSPFLSAWQEYGEQRGEVGKAWLGGPERGSGGGKKKFHGLKFHWPHLCKVDRWDSLKSGLAGIRQRELKCNRGNQAVMKGAAEPKD